MNNRRMMSIATIAMGLAPLCGASAHVVLAVREAPAGSYYKAIFQVPHGCDGAATTAIRVDLPEGIVIAKPAPKPGWQLTIEREPLARPVVNEGHEITERVKEVIWSGGHLPNDEYDEFTVMVRLPPQVGQLSFPVVQTCGTQEVAWVQERLPETDAAPPHPAPSVRLTQPGNRD